MSSKKDLTKVHRCVAAKCKGILKGKPEDYGYWAYWNPETMEWQATEPKS